SRVPRGLVQPAQASARRLHPDHPGQRHRHGHGQPVPRHDRPGVATERSHALLPGNPGIAEPELQPAVVRARRPDRRPAVGGPGQADVEGFALSQQPWGGRFGEEPDPLIDQFTGSLDVDRRLFREDIAGSRAWAKALVRAGVLTPDEQSRIDQALREIETEFAAGDSSEGEDIHMAVEKRLREKLGPLGGKLHTGRSRNDQVALDLRLYVRAAGTQLLEALAGLESALIARAEEHLDTVMPGYTHTQRAQPVLLPHHLLAYVEMLRRDRVRFAGALGCTAAPSIGSGSHPCAAELVRAKSGRVAGDLVNLLMVLKGLPLAYNRDLQEDKEALFDGVDTTLTCLHVTARLVQGLRFDRDVMRKAALEGYTLAT